jgi:hypothetical protein
MIDSSTFLSGTQPNGTGGPDEARFYSKFHLLGQAFSREMPFCPRPALPTL